MKEKIFTKEEIIKKLKEHKDIFKRYDVNKIGLFGSFVSGKQRKNSDIDFLVEFKISTFDNYMGLRSELENKLKKKIDLVSIKALKECIKPYILKDVIWL